MFRIHGALIVSVRVSVCVTACPSLVCVPFNPSTVISRLSKTFLPKLLNMSDLI